MPVMRSYNDATPVDLLINPSPQGDHLSPEEAKVRDYVLAWRNKLRYERIEKVNIWNECWALYRGQEDFTNKEDWQSKIVLPKAWGTVKQAVNVIKRLMNLSKKPWKLESQDVANPLWQLRGEKMTNLTNMFLEKAKFSEEFTTGLECGFIMGVGIWKLGWNLSKRNRMRIQMVQMPVEPLQAAPPITPQGPIQNLPPELQQAAMRGQMPAGPLEQQQQPVLAPEQIGQSRQELPVQQNVQYPTQLPQEALMPPGSLNSPMGGPVGGLAPIMVPQFQKQVVQEEVLEGNLTINAVDPYFFYWLPGSKLNKWTGTIEEIGVPKWQLLEMAQEGAFDPELIEKIGPMLIPEYQRQVYLRFGEMPRGPSGPTKDTGIIKLTEFYGPLVIEGKVVEKDAHIIIANDTWVLKNGRNESWFGTPPYCAYSPLSLPFRTEGTGLVEMVRYIDRALNQIVNLGVDTLLFRLNPLFEFTPDLYENPEDLRNGITPGKMLRRNQIVGNTDMGIRPVKFEDVSPGASSMAGILDRSHQEGGLVSELQQSLPRWSGAQTATETQAIQQNQNSFFGSLASDIEKQAIQPIVKMASELIMQYIDTANDPRVSAVLGIDQVVLAGMSHAEIYEMINGDYDVKVTGLSDQIDKADMLQNLIQLMNIIGQNPQAWLPYINQDALLRRILDSFRPTIHDIEQIVADPQTVAANKAAQQQSEQQAQLMKMMPELQRLQQEQQMKQMDLQHDMAKHQDTMMQRAADQAIEAKHKGVM